MHRLEKTKKPKRKSLTTLHDSSSPKDTNMKIDEIYTSYVNTEENKSYQINIESNIEIVNKNSMDVTVSSDAGPSSPSRSRVSADITSQPDFPMLSTQNSNVIEVGNQNEVFPSESYQKHLNPLVAFARSFIKDYTEESLEEEYDLERNILLNEDFLYECRQATYMSFKKNLNIRMRVMLFDWLMEVCSQLSFKRATFHLAVVLVDVYLSRNKDLKTKELQLLGVTCLIISAKIEVLLIINFSGNSNS